MDDTLREMADAAGVAYNGATDQPVIEPTVERNVVGDYLFTWETRNGEFIRVKCADVAFVRGEMHVRLSVVYKSHKGSTPRTLLSRKRWIPESNSSTSSQFTELNRWKNISADWPTTLTWVSTYFENNFETGDPFVWLDEVVDPGPLRYLLEPLVQDNEHTLIGAKGGSLKSMTALAICLSLATQRTIIPGLEPRAEKPVRCLYIDYETNGYTHRRRLGSIAQSKGIVVPPQMIGYKRLTTPLVQMKSELQQLIALKGVGFVVVDSVGRAVGGETVGETDVQSYYNATSAFGVPILSIGHTSKTNNETVAGNAQWENQARSMWIFEAAKEHGSNSVIVGMHHRKVNEGELLPSLNYAVTFGEGGVSYAQAQDEDVKQITGVDMKTRIRIFLGDRPNSTAKEISEALERSDTQVANALKTWAGRLWKSDGERPAKWMLLTPMNSPVKQNGVEEDITYLPSSYPNSQGSEKQTYENNLRLPYKDGAGDDDLSFE